MARTRWGKPPFVTAKLKDRLVPLPAEQAKGFADLSATQVRNPEGMERLADGKIILNGRALLGSDVNIRRGHLRLPDGNVYQLVTIAPPTNHRAAVA